MKRFLSLIPLVILICSQMYCLYIISNSNIVFGNKQYIGSFFIATSIILLLLKKRNWSILLTGVSLLLGTLNYLAFLPVIESYSFGFSLNDKGGIEITIQPFSALIFLIYLFLDYKTVAAFVRNPSENMQKKTENSKDL